jgi:hypothetical protein
LWQGASLGARLAAERAGRPEPDISDTVYVLRNIEYGFFSWLWSGVTSHWIYGPHLDVISSTFAALGLVILALGRLPGYVGGWLAGWRGRLWLVSTYLGALAATAGMNPYPQVSNNRMFALLPYYAIWAALGAEQLLIWFTSLIGKAAWRGPAVAGLLAAVCALGFYQMSVLAPTKQAKPIPTTLALRIIQEEPPQGKVCFFGRDQYNLEIPRSFYSAFQITTDQFFVTNDQPPPVNDSGCGVILLDVGINNVEGIAAEVEAQHPNAARSNVRDDSGALQAIRFNLTD